jgi:hypothetical protein
MENLFFATNKLYLFIKGYVKKKQLIDTNNLHIYRLYRLHPFLLTQILMEKCTLLRQNS